MIEGILRAKVSAYLSKPYACENRQMACVLFVLEVMEPFSPELRECLGRLRCMEITGSKKALIRQDYFLKFIRGTKLQLTTDDRQPTTGLLTGDILLINEYSIERKIDHLGLYLGQGEYVHLHRDRNIGDYPQMRRVDDDRHKILGIVRADDLSVVSQGVEYGKS